MKFKENRSLDGKLLGYWRDDGTYAFPAEVLNEDGSVKLGLEVVPMTQSEIDGNRQTLELAEAEHKATQYHRDRVNAYPSYADQFDLLYHGGYDAWKASIDAVKTQFPKPEGA